MRLSFRCYTRRGLKHGTVSEAQVHNCVAQVHNGVAQVKHYFKNCELVIVRLLLLLLGGGSWAWPRRQERSSDQGARWALRPCCCLVTYLAAVVLQWYSRKTQQVRCGTNLLVCSADKKHD